MKSSKQSEAWGTGSAADHFVRARWKLTGLYVLILTVVVVFLSFTLYTIHGNQVREQRDRDIEQAHGHTLAPGGPSIPEPRLEEYLEALGRSIVLLDVVTIFLAGSLSYWLAGRTLRPIRQAFADEQRFFANAAHDLRTPLAVMKTEIEVALRDPSAKLADAKKALGSSLEEIDRMSALVQELLLLGTPSSGAPNQKAEREVQEISDFVQTAVDRMRARAEALGITLQADPSPPILIPLRSDFERALANVLENAMKFTPAGGSVTVSLLATKSHVDVLVADTGIGIAADDLPQVLDPFYRADAARSLPGSGLGLSIVQQILTEHRGSIEISSQLGQGTTVRLRLPRN